MATVRGFSFNHPLLDVTADLKYDVSLDIGNSLGFSDHQEDIALPLISEAYDKYDKFGPMPPFMSPSGWVYDMDRQWQNIMDQAQNIHQDNFPSDQDCKQNYEGGRVPVFISFDYDIKEFNTII